MPAGENDMESGKEEKNTLKSTAQQRRASLLLHLHPVAGSTPAPTTSSDLPSLVDGASVEEQLCDME